MQQSWYAILNTTIHAQYLPPLLCLSRSLLCISTLLESGNRKHAHHCHPSTSNMLTVVCAMLADYSRMFGTPLAPTGIELG